jgi:hypothetical protein
MYVFIISKVIKSFTTWKWCVINLYVDTSVRNHMTHDIESFVSYYKWEKGQFVCVGDNSTHEIIGQAKVSIKLNDGTVKPAWIEHPYVQFKVFKVRRCSF